MFFFFFQVILDISLIFFVYVLAYIVKFKIIFSWDITEIVYTNYVEHARFATYSQLMFIIIIVWIFSLFFFGVYKERKGILSGVEEFLNIVKSSILSTLLIILATFLFKNEDYSRYVFAYGAIFSVIFISINHFFNFKIKSFFRNLHNQCERSVILGTGETAQNIYARIINNEKHNYDLKGAFGIMPENLLYAIEKKFTYLGNKELFIKYIRENKIATVFIVTAELTVDEMSCLFEELISIDVKVKFQPSFLNIGLGKLESSDDFGMVFFNISSNKLSFVSRLIKRIFDLSISFPLLFLFSPLFILISIIIKLTDAGNIFFVQERVGINGKNFMMYKFRTMPENIEDDTGPVLNTIEIANRATFIGKILRKTSLDELPQLINIIKGEMSLVGPRPERPIFVKEFSQKYSDYPLRHNVLPGLTGWAQLNGRAALSTRVNEKIMYDLFYINNWSLLFDIKIIIKTLIYVLSWQGAY
jgi:exopolysaccharide biosynthesis polyprenyl glycosylphosphotransferase